MGYYVRSLPSKKKQPNWKIQFVSYQKSNVFRATAKKPKKEWDVSPERWRGLGFHRSMSFKEAGSRAKQLNAQAFLKRQEEALRKFEKRVADQRQKFCAVLPEEFVSEFEQRFLRQRYSETDQKRRKRSRAHTIWRSAQKMVIALQVEPSEWFDHTYEIYDHFYQCRFSISYVTKILRIANLWGYFICRKMGRPFLSIPFPRGHERLRLIDAFHQKTAGRRKASAPLLQEDLTRVKGKLKPQNFNWLYLSVWFGLRPQEVDQLKETELWEISVLPNRIKVLWVFQTKIVALPPEQRWKGIPAIYPQQRWGLRMIPSGNFERPFGNVMKKYFGSDVNLYGGRKGFTDLMLSRGHTLENISHWMGHTTLDQTWRNYKNRQKSVRPIGLGYLNINAIPRTPAKGPSNG